MYYLLRSRLTSIIMSRNTSVAFMWKIYKFATITVASDFVLKLRNCFRIKSSQKICRGTKVGRLEAVLNVFSDFLTLKKCLCVYTFAFSDRWQVHQRLFVYVLRVPLSFLILLHPVHVRFFMTRHHMAIKSCEYPN